MNYQTLMNELSLEEKIGQMFMMAFAGRRFDEVQLLIQEKKIGACYISQDNASTPEEAVELSNNLQKYALHNSSQIPMLICADQEGSWGVVVPFTSTGPGNLALGATNQSNFAYGMYEIYGKELRALGYNTILSPCVDVRLKPNFLTNAMRSFGNDPSLVSNMAVGAVKGAHAGDIICCVKHFPGHGDSGGDTHRDLATVVHSIDEWERIDLLPFKAGIDAGADIVMTAHTLFPALDPIHPATFSSIILKDILREKLQFDGVILTDSLNMGAIRKHYDPGDAAVSTIKAGADLIMLAEEHYDHDSNKYLEKQFQSIDSVISAVKDGSISENRINESVERILKLKEKYNLFNSRFVELEKANIVGSEPHRKYEIEVSSHAIKILRGNHSDFELSLVEKIVVVNTIVKEKYALLTQSRGIGPNQAVPVFDTFVDLLKQKRDEINVVKVEDIKSADIYREVLSSSDKIIIVTEDYQIPAVTFVTNDEYLYVSSIINEFPEKVLIIAFRDPNELLAYPNVNSYVCAYSSRPCAAHAMVNFLFK